MMRYTVLSDHIIGGSHGKTGAACEDCSDHYCDGQGRYAIAVVCDGHSDPKCFRSAAGARFGCDTAIEILRGFLEAYCREEPGEALEQLLDSREQAMTRLRTAFVSAWNRRVEEDLEAQPITDQEFEALDHPKYRSALELFRAGRARSHIYGATLLAVAVCEDFCLAMHIGDGIIVMLTGEGEYVTPLPADDREDMEGPASLCDYDLLTRPGAFRVELMAQRPQAMFVTSDGIGDMPLSVYLREHLCKLQRELMSRAEEPSDRPLEEMNEAQKRLLRSFIAYFSGAGLEDDCCLAGFYDRTEPVADVRLPQSELDRLHRELRERLEEEERSYLESRERLEQVRTETERKLDGLGEELHRLGSRLEELDAARQSAEERAGQVLESMERLERRHGERVDDLRRQEQALDARYGGQ